MSDFLNIFNTTCIDVNNIILEKWPGSIKSENIDGGLAWAEKHAPKLAKDEEKHYCQIAVQWDDAGIETFIKTVTDWGRTMLKVYKTCADARQKAIAEKSQMKLEVAV